MLTFWHKLGKTNQLILSESHLPEFGNVDLGKNSSIVVEHTSEIPTSITHWSCKKYHNWRYCFSILKSQLQCKCSKLH